MLLVYGTTPDQRQGHDNWCLPVVSEATEFNNRDIDMLEIRFLQMANALTQQQYCI